MFFLAILLTVAITILARVSYQKITKTDNETGIACWCMIFFGILPLVLALFFAEEPEHLLGYLLLVPLAELFLCWILVLRCSSDSRKEKEKRILQNWFREDFKSWRYQHVYLEDKIRLRVQHLREEVGEAGVELHVESELRKLWEKELERHHMMQPQQRTSWFFFWWGG